MYKRQAYERGVKVVGVTAHFVTPHLDEGPIIAQEVLRVRSNETLAAIVKRGQRLETRCVLRAVRAYVTKRLDVHWGRVYSCLLYTSPILLDCDITSIAGSQPCDSPSSCSSFPP